MCYDLGKTKRPLTDSKAEKRCELAVVGDNKIKSRETSAIKQDTEMVGTDAAEVLCYELKKADVTSTVGDKSTNKTDMVCLNSCQICDKLCFLFIYFNHNSCFS